MARQKPATHPQRVAAAAPNHWIRSILARLWREPRGSVLIRFDQPPPSGRSRNYVDGHQEAGVSCYLALLTEARLMILAAGMDLRSTRRKLCRALREGAAVHQCLGICVARGTDGEPVVRLEESRALKRRRTQRIVVNARPFAPSTAEHARASRRLQRACR